MKLLRTIGTGVKVLSDIPFGEGRLVVGEGGEGDLRLGKDPSAVLGCDLALFTDSIFEVGRKVFRRPEPATAAAVAAIAPERRSGEVVVASDTPSS